MSAEVLALAEAAAGAVGYGAASVVQARAARDDDGLGVVAKPWYAAGLVADLLAWVASILAMRSLPLFVVQSLLATSRAVTVLLAWPVLGHRPARRDALAIGVVVLTLIGLAWSAGPEVAGASGGGLLAAVVGALVLGIGWFVGRARAGGGVEHALLAGWAFSWLAVCVRALPLPPGLGAAGRAAATEPLAWAVAAFGVLGTLAFARAVQRGRVGPVTATMWVVEVLVSGAVGILALGDGVRTGTGGLAAGCVVAALAACVVLGADFAAAARGSTGDQPREPGREQPLGDQRLTRRIGMVTVPAQQVGHVPVRRWTVESGVQADEGDALPPGDVPEDGVGPQGERPRGPDPGC